jgi:predicted MFS family arabinose efflux permease
MKERTVVLLVAAVQFVNILDFMMVMPLGPDFAVALGISTSHIGVLGGAYTLAAAIAGVAGASFLDRFDRRSALAVAMLGLVLSTAAGGFAVDLYTLIGARLLAGAFGGPATSLSLAIVADVVPPERRGKAVGTVMTAFSLASILGVPAGLRMAEWLGWRAPFFGVALLGLVLTAAALSLMPSLRGHLDGVRASTRAAAARMPFDQLTRTTLLNTALVMLGVFAIVPNISTFLQRNLGYPRADLDTLYLVGGAASFIANRGVGSLVDRFGATRMVAGGTLVFGCALYFGFLRPVTVDHVIWVFPLLMLSATMRGVPLNTLASRVPPPSQRARFMSAQNAVQHIASSGGALGASALLEADPSGKLYGMERVTAAAILISLFVPLLAAVVERGVRERERERAAVPPPPTVPSELGG